jgi:hypothetical protein
MFNFKPLTDWTMEMGSEEEKWEKLDAEFDHFVVDMKPFVLKLPHRSGKIVFETRYLGLIFLYYYLIKPVNCQKMERNLKSFSNNFHY